MRHGIRLAVSGFVALAVTEFVRGQDCYEINADDIVCGSGGSGGNSILLHGGGGMLSIQIPESCRVCHDPTYNATCFWPRNLPEGASGIFQCWPAGYFGPTPRPTSPDGPGPLSPPQPLSFADEGAVVYTNPIDPKADATRDNVYVDPAGGSLRLRLPLNLSFKGRNETIDLDMIFNSARNHPGGMFGHYWSGSWEHKLVADYVRDRGASECADPLPPEPEHVWVKSLARIEEHQGGGTTIWTNPDAIEETGLFTGLTLTGIPETEFKFYGLPSGNLHGGWVIRPPNGGSRVDYELINITEYLANQGRPVVLTAPLGPAHRGRTDLGGIDDGIRHPFVPPLGEDRKMRFACGGTEIRSPDGRIDRFGPFHQTGEHWVDLLNTPEFEHPYRSQWMADLISTELPSGDRIHYRFDDHGRTAGIQDEFGREVATFTYDGDTLRLLAISDLLGRAVVFQYDSIDLLHSITLARTGQTWQFFYTSHKVDPPNFELREIIKQEKLRVLDSFTACSPQGGGGAVISAVFGNQAPSSLWTVQPCVTSLTIGGARGFDLNLDGTSDYSFTSDLTVNYAYTVVDPNDPLGDHTTTMTDSLGHQRIHVFDWQSREKSRSERVLYDGATTDLVTQFNYSGFHPKVVETIHPRGNKTVELFRFQIDDAVPAPSYYDEGPRDRFHSNQLLTRTLIGFVGEAPIVESWTYEPIYDQVWAHTDPRGFVTANTYDYQEAGLDATLSAFVGTWHIDATALVGQPGLGDVNGDGSVNQRLGRRIRVREPPVSAPSLTTQHYGTQEAVTFFAYNDKGQRIWEQDPAGVFTNYTYYLGPAPNEGPQTTAAGGYVGSMVNDALGAHLVTEFGYDEIGRELWVISPRGFPIVKAYNESDLVVEQIEGNVTLTGAALGNDYRDTQFVYDLNDNLIEKRVRIDTAATPELNYAGANPGWVTTRVGYDGLDQVRAVAEERFDPLAGGSPAWNITWFHYDGNGRTTKEVSAAGRAISYEYDSLGRVKRKRRHALVDPTPDLPTLPSASSDDALLELDHDFNSNLTAATVIGDSVDHAYSILYDGFDRRVQLFDPVGTVTTQTLDAAGNISRVEVDGDRVANDTDPGILRDVEYSWDERGRLAHVRSRYFEWESHGGGPITFEELWGGDELGYVDQDFAYDARGLTTFERDDLGRESEVQYDGVGREIRTYQPLVVGFTNRNFLERAYDANDNLIQEIEHSFGIENSVEQQDTLEVTSSFDALDRKIEERRQPNAVNPVVTTYSWSSLDDPIKSVNPNGLGTRRKFDTLHREVVTEFGWNSTFTAGQIVDPLYNTDGLLRTERQFDGEGKLLIQRDDSGNATQWNFDPIGRLLETIQADLSKEKVTYDRSGAILSETRTFDQSGVDTLFTEVDYQYDLGLRKVRADFSLNQGVTGLSGVFLEEFGYDGLSRACHAETQAYVPNSTDLFKTSLDKVYDSLDHVRCDDQGFTIDHASQLDYNSFVCVESEYDGVGNRTEVSTPGYVRDYVFDDLNRVKEVRDGTGAVLHSFDWIGGGYRLNAQQNLNGTSTKVGFGGYDEQRRLKRVDHYLASSQGGTAFATLLYEYDQVGNQLKEVKNHLPNNSQRLTYDTGNRLTKFEEGNNGTGAWTEKQKFNLDGVGNWRKHKIAGATWINAVDVVHEYGPQFDNKTVTYDQRGNLTQYGNKGFVHDVRGRVVAATVGSGAQQDYAYDAEGRRLAAEGWVSVYEGLREIRQVRIQQSSQTRTYTYGAGLDDVLLYETGSTRYWLHKNRNGSTIALTNAAGALVERYDYTPYGTVTMTDVDGGGLIRAPYLFAGRRWDQTAGLYFMRARYYMPDMGRFTSRDPIGFWGDGNNWGNPFNYGGTNPLSGDDPSGNFWDTVFDFIAVTLDVAMYHYHVAVDDLEAANQDLAWLTADLIAAATPFVLAPGIVRVVGSGGGAAIRGGAAVVNGARQFANATRPVRAVHAAAAATELANAAHPSSEDPGKPTTGPNGNTLNGSKVVPSRQLIGGGKSGSIDGLLKDATPGKVGKVKQFKKPGGFDHATKDFDALVGDAKVKDQGNEVRSATLPDGSNVSVRPFSGKNQKGPPTIQVNPRSGKPIKVRYEN